MQLFYKPGWGDGEITIALVGPDGEHDAWHYLRLFKDEVLADIPEPPKPKLLTIRHEGQLYKVQDQTAYKEHERWYAEYKAATSDEKFVAWMVKNHGFTEVSQISSW